MPPHQKKIIEKVRSWKDTTTILNLALINVYQGKISQLIGATIHLITKIQILALCFKFSYKFLPVTSTWITKFSNLIADVFIFKDLFSFASESAPAKVAFFVIHIYNIILMAMLLLLLSLIVRRKHINQNLQGLWSLLIYIHCLIFLFPCFNFSISGVIYWARGDIAIFSTASMNYILVPICSILTLSWNMCVIMLSNVFLLTSLQANSPLSMKTNLLQQFEVAEKCLLFLLSEAMSQNEAAPWLILILCLVSTIVKNIYVYLALPYYSMQTLRNDILMNSSITTITILNVIAKIIIGSKHSFGSSEVILAWLLFSPFAAKFFYNRLQNIYSTLLRAVIDDTSPDHLLHRIPLYRLYLMKKVELNLENDKVDFFNLYITGKNHIMKPYVKDTGEQVTFDLTNRYHFKIYALSLLRDSVKLHNDYWPLKVAYIRLLTEYAFFVQALYFIEQTKKVSLTLNQEAILYILQSEIESILLKKYENQKPQKLNMLRFLEASNTYNSLRTQIMQQINEQQTFWHTYQHRKVNFINLVNFSNKIESRKLEIQKFWKQNEMNIEENFISLYLIYGVYLELANYRPTNGSVMINQYTRKSAAIKKIFDRDELSNDTIFAPENTSIEISGVKETLGTILECSHSIRKSFGFHREEMIGLNITTILPDWLKDKHNNALFHFYETGTKTVLNHTRQVLAMTSSGYLFPTHIHVRLNPFLENKISYVGLLKPMKQSLNCLIILPDGTIDGLTKEIASELNIQPNSRINMLEICPDFQTISDVTNSVAYHQITGKEDFEMLFIDLNEVNKKSMRRKRRFTSYKSNSPQDTSIPVSPSDSEKQFASRSPFSRRSIHENFTRVFQQSTRFLDYESALQHYNRYREEGAEVTLYCFQDPRKGFFKTFKQLRAHVRVENMVVGQDWARVVFINTFIEHKWSHPHNKRSSTIKLAELDSHQSIQTRHDGERTRKNKSRTEPEVGAFSRLRLSTKISIEEEGLGGASPFKLNYFRSSGGVDSEGYPLADETIPLEKKVSRHFNYKVTINSDSNVVTPPSNNLITQTKTQIPKTTQGETKLTYIEETEHKGGDIENPNAKPQAKENESSAKKVQAIRIEQKEIDNFEGPASSFGWFFQQGMKLKIQKALEEAIESHNKTRKYTYFTLAFIMCMILIASTVLIQMGMSINAFNDISEKNQIITTANERLDSLIFTNFNLREWYCLIQGKFGNISEPTYSELMKDKKTILTSEIKRLSTNNNNLREAVDLINQRVQNNFYDTSVHVYDVALNGTPEGFTLDNTFTTIQKMLSSGFTFVAANSYPPFQPNQDMMFFLYNSYNDLLISNDNSVNLLISDMENKISGYQSGLSGVTASVAIALVVFLLSSLMIINKIKKSVQSFGAFFFRIDDLDAKVIANNLNSFDKLLTENYQDEALLSNLNVIEESAKERDVQTRGRLGNKNVVYKIYNLQNQLLVLRLWPLVLLVMGLLIGFSGIKLNNVSQIKKFHEQSIASGSNLINMNLAVSLFVEMIGANMTTKIENQPILNQFTIVLENLSQTQALLDYFKDSKGQIESSKSELLSNFSCNTYFEGQSSDFTELCYNISAGAGSTSIVAINNQIWQMAHEGWLSYLNTNQTPEEQTEVLLNGNKTYPSLIKVGRQLNLELWRQVLADFQLFLNSQTKQTYQFSIYFEVLTIIILICSFPWALTKINDKDYELKKMFKLVPLNIILKNRWLKAYLVINSNKILHPLKNVL